MNKKEYLRQYCQKNKKRLRQLHQKYYFSHLKEAKEYSKKYRKRNKDKLTNYAKIYYRKNKQKLKIKSYLYRKLYKTQKAQYDKIYRRKNIEKIVKYHYKYYRTHKQNKQQYDKEYRMKNRNRINKSHRKDYKKNRQQRLKRLKEYRNILHNKLANNLRARVRLALKGSYKNLSTLSLLGCSVNKFEIHLEKQFKPGMVWKNYGKRWEIDHIRPCCSFDLSKEIEQKKCFHYTNLRPLTTKENRSKGGTYGKRK